MKLMRSGDVERHPGHGPDGYVTFQAAYGPPGWADQVKVGFADAIPPEPKPEVTEPRGQYTRVKRLKRRRTVRGRLERMCRRLAVVMLLVLAAMCIPLETEVGHQDDGAPAVGYGHVACG